MNIVKTKINDVALICSVPSCDQKTHAKNFCNKHYRRFLKLGSGNLEDVRSKKCKQCKEVFFYTANKQTFCSKKCKRESYLRSLPMCQYENCQNRSSTLSSRICSTHKTRIRKHSDPDFVLKIHKYADSELCIVQGCKSKPRAKKMCSKHWQMWRKHGDPLGGRFEYKIRKAITHKDGTRTCSECNRRLHISNFHKDRTATDGYRSKCKDCRIGKVKEWYSENAERQSSKAREFRKKNIDKLRKRDKERYEKDKPKRLDLASKHAQIRRSRKKMLPYDERITRNRIRQKLGDNCYYCGVEMDFTPASGRKFKKNHATIEHLIPLSKGGHHIWENVVLACHNCNVVKNAKSEIEFRIYLQEINNSTL